MFLPRQLTYSVGIIVCLVLSSTSQAFLFPADDIEFIAQSCALVFTRKLPNGKPDRTLCTATVVAKRYLITAGHCGYGVEWDSRGVECPNEPMRIVKDIYRHEDFRMEKDGENWKLPVDLKGKDIAVVEMEENMDTSPMRIPKDKQELTEIINKRPMQCTVHGYGYDAAGDRGNPNCANIEINDFTFVDRGLLRSDKKVMKLGDSGAGLICKDSNSEPIQMGVYHGNADAPDLPIYGSATFVSLKETLEWVHSIIDSSTPKPRKHDSTKGHSSR